MANEHAPRRRSLTHVGGPTDTEGNPADAARLARALDVPPATDEDDDPARTHVHGFHTYPARMHPGTAARLVAAFAPPGGRVLDPFCGSGTVLVEAVLAGRAAHGTDLNPIGVRLAECKTKPRTQADIDALVARAAEVADHADARRAAKAGATRRFPTEDTELFEPHVLLELDSLRAKIESLRDDPLRPDLWLVLSAILVKLSRKRGDTAAGVAPRRTRAGMAAKLFSEKATDLARRLGEFAHMAPEPRPPATARIDDAAVLRTVPDGGIDAVVTSPPYAATYDYFAHHAIRMRWLGLDPGPLARGEMGSRSAYRRVRPEHAAARWEQEVGRFLTALAPKLRAGGPAVLVMGDSAVEGVAIRADEVVAAAARGCGFEPAARASQPRPHFHGPTAAAFRARPRFEHALLLRKR